MSRTYSLYSYFDTIIFSPVIPSDLRLDQIGNTVRLSWLDKSSYEDGFVIERKEEGGSWRKAYFIDQQRDYFIDYGPFDTGKTYYYRVSSYIILPNQNYMISDPSNEADIQVVLSSASTDDVSIVEVEFGQTSSISLDIKETTRIYVKDASDSVDYLWFDDGDLVIVTGHDDYADVFPIKSGSGTIRVKKKDGSGEAIINVIVTREDIEGNPIVIRNLRARSLSNSSVELLWNYNSDPDPDVSHFEIYRLERSGSSSKYNLVDFDDLNKNKVGIVPFDSTESIYNFYDYGLRSGRSYVYTVAAVSKYNKNSLYVQKEEYDFVSNRKYVAVRIEQSDIEIDPSIAYVNAGQSVYLGILNTNNKTFSAIEWSIENNNSGSSLRSDDEEVTYFEASDKTISEDGIKVQADSDVARSRVIVTETI